MTAAPLADLDELGNVRNVSALTGASVDRLFHDSEIEAEYTIGWVRITAGFVLIASGLGVSSGIASLTEGQLLHQTLLTSLITVGAFLFLGLTSLLLVV